MAESIRRRLERAEDESLAPYAVRSAHVTRRYPIENEGRAFEYRTQFQRDRDRIVYSRAFRRLRQKAQAGILPAYEDHRRNRLTHTLEVTQLARTMGRALRLNEDLIEAVALGHDLGQPPFGPVGERALDDLMSGRLDGKGGPGLGDLGGFRREWQSLRVVDHLEKRYDHPGLNLTDAVREGVFKTGAAHSTLPSPVDGFDPATPPGLEIQVVVLADRIASALHDLDDALQSGTVDTGQVERLRAVRELRKKLGSRWPSHAGRFVKANAIHRGLTHMLVTGSILASEASIGRWASRGELTDAGSSRGARSMVIGGGEIRLPDSGSRLLADLEGFLEAKVRRGQEADRVEATGRRALLGLFAAYHADASLLDDHVLLRFKQTQRVRYLRDLPRSEVEGELARRYRNNPGFARLLADHLAGMTDAYALTEYARLMRIGAVPIPSVEQLRREETGEKPAEGKGEQA